MEGGVNMLVLELRLLSRDSSRSGMDSGYQPVSATGS